MKVSEFFLSHIILPAYFSKILDRSYNMFYSVYEFENSTFGTFKKISYGSE